MNNKICLNWHGPFSFEVILTNAALRQKYCCPGVYVWSESLPDDQWRLSYVGKATQSTTLWGRHLQHYASMVGGLYRIPKEFGEWHQDWIPDWTRKDVVATMLDQSSFFRIVEAGFKRAAATEIYLCPLPEAKDLTAVERQLLYELQPTGTKRGTRSPPKTNLVLEHINAPWQANPLLWEDR